MPLRYVVEREPRGESREDRELFREPHRCRPPQANCCHRAVPVAFSSLQSSSERPSVCLTFTPLRRPRRAVPLAAVAGTSPKLAAVVAACPTGFTIASTHAGNSIDSSSLGSILLRPPPYILP